MSGDFFPHLNAVLLSGLQALKGGGDARDSLRLSAILLNEGLSLAAIEQQEKDVARLATASALRVIFEQSVAHQKLTNIYDEYAKVLSSILIEKERPIFEWKHMKPFFSAVLYMLDLNDVRMELLFGPLKELVAYCHANDTLRKELYSDDFLPAIGKLVSSLLSIISSDRLSNSSRIDGLLLLQRVLAESPVETVAMFLPGTLMKLTELMRLSSLAAGILCNCTRAYSLTITRALSNKEWDTVASDDEAVASTSSAVSKPNAKQVKDLRVKRDKKWFTETAEKVRTLIYLSCPVLASHESELVRGELLTFLDELRHAEKPFGDSLLRLHVDIGSILLSDSSTSVQNQARGFLDSVQARHETAYSAYVYELLKKIQCELAAASNGDEDSASPGTPDANFMVNPRLLDQVLSLIRILPDLRVLCFSGAFRGFLQAIFSLIAVDTARLPVVSCEIDNLQAFIRTLPLKHGITLQWLHQFCGELLTREAEEVLTLLSAMINDTSASQQTGITFFMCAVGFQVQQLHIEAQDDKLAMCAETVQEWLDRRELIEAQLDLHGLKDIAMANSRPVASYVAQLAAYGTLVAAIRDVHRRDTLLSRSFSSLLLATNVQNIVVSTAADLAMAHIAEAYGQSVATLLQARAALVVNSMWLWDSNVLSAAAPRLFTAIVSKTNDPTMYLETKRVATQLLKTLDKYNEEFSYAILCSLSTYVEALERWFPEPPANQDEAQTPSLNDEPMELPDDVEKMSLDDEMPDFKKTPPPDHVKLTEEILQRTATLLSSDHFHVRVRCLRLLTASLKVVAGCDDVLLPMVHQNWAALKNRLVDDNLNVRIEAVKALKIYCLTAKSFVYRRVSEDGWPRLTSWAEKQLGRSQYTQSETYRLLYAILDSSYPIWRAIGYRAEPDAPAVLPFLRKVAGCSQCPLEARRKAEESLEAISKITSSND